MPTRSELRRSLEERLRAVHLEQHNLDKEEKELTKVIDHYRKLENGTHTTRTRAPASVTPSADDIEEYVRNHPNLTSKEIFNGGGFGGSNGTIDNRLKILREEGRLTKSNDFPARWNVAAGR